MKKYSKYIIIFLISSVFILELVNIYFTNKVSIDSLKAADLQEKIDNLGEENEMIKTDILKYTSIHVIYEKAKKLGFSEPKEQIIIEAPLGIAAKHD
jgi:cell division protein FtsL